MNRNTHIAVAAAIAAGACLGMASGASAQTVPGVGTQLPKLTPGPALKSSAPQIAGAVGLGMGVGMAMTGSTGA